MGIIRGFYITLQSIPSSLPITRLISLLQLQHFIFSEFSAQNHLRGIRLIIWFLSKYLCMLYRCMHSPSISPTIPISAGRTYKACCADERRIAERNSCSLGAPGDGLGDLERRRGGVAVPGSKTTFLTTVLIETLLAVRGVLGRSGLTWRFSPRC